MKPSGQPWILSARYDSAFILAPALVVALIASLFHQQLIALGDMPNWLWLLLIVGIDAGHVYTTLFRTYLEKQAWRQFPALLTFIPLGVWMLGCLLYSMDSFWFWRALVYLAMFHFVRQQYGFMMIYARNEKGLPGYFRKIDQAAIYSATLYPLLYWHLHQRNFDWFIAGDILPLHLPQLGRLIDLLYAAVLCIYALKEIKLFKLTKTLNWPRNLMLAGTALSWYVGIVAFNNDLIFSATNIVAHGVPYYALIWAYGFKHNRREIRAQPYVFKWVNKLFIRRNACFYLLLMLLLAYTEEGLWDGLIWQEHVLIFAAFSWLRTIHTPALDVWLVPLLTLPQSTHYLLDAYIWRLHKTGTDWKKILFHPVELQS